MKLILGIRRTPSTRDQREAILNPAVVLRLHTFRKAPGGLTMRTGFQISRISVIGLLVVLLGSSLAVAQTNGTAAPAAQSPKPAAAKPIRKTLP